MTKSNPLFVDSTRIHGDRIPTQVELDKVILFDGERISITVTGYRGDPVHTQLEPIGENTYGARIWLKHLEKINYQFVVENEERRVFHTPIKQARAEHAIIENWEPTMEETPALIDLKQEEQPVARTWVSEAASKAESLIEKWDL
jgi:hypothetical protein